MANGRPGVWRVGRRLGGVFSAVAVYLVQVLSLHVIGLQIFVRDRPSGGNTAVVPNLPKIFFPQAEKRRSIKLGVPTNVIVRMRMEVLAVLIEPRLLGVVVTLHVDQLRVPVGFLARHVIAALKDKKSLARRCEMICQRAPAGSRTDNNYVITLAHDSNPPFAPQNMQRLLFS